MTRQAYPTDLNDTQWTLIAPLLPQKESIRGRPRTWTDRDILDGILYIVRGGCGWHLMPHDLPPWQTVYGYYWRWRNMGLWEKINAILVQCVRVQEGRDPQPSAGIIDSQSVKTSEGGEERGVDVHKQVSVRKRHIIVDTLGLLLLALVHRASIPDGNGGKLVLAKLLERIKHSLYNRWCRFKLIWADALAEFKLAFTEFVPTEESVAPSTKQPVSEMMVTIAGETCTIDDPAPLQAGEIKATLNIKDQNKDLYALTMFNLDADKDFLDLMAATVGTPPSWADILLMKEQKPGTNNTYTITVEKGPVYMICWSNPPDLPMGNAGPIEVKP